MCLHALAGMISLCNNTWIKPMSFIVPHIRSVNVVSENRKRNVHPERIQLVLTPYNRMPPNLILLSLSALPAHTRRCDPSRKRHRHTLNIVPRVSDDARRYPTSDGARVNLRATRRSVDGIALLGGTVGLIACSEIVEKLCLGVN